MVLVVDASVAMGWIIQSQTTPLTEDALQTVASDSGLVPAHFGIEIARALRNRERRNLLTPEISDAVLAQLQGLPLRQDKSDALDVVRDVVTLARRHALQVADAAYLELALRTGLSLATQDDAVARAALAAGVKLFGAA